MRYGSNEMAIPITSIPMIIFKEMWHPFYVFQYFAVVIWIVGGWPCLAGLVGCMQGGCGACAYCCALLAHGASNAAWRVQYSTCPAH
jgi:hypothetical protein